MLLIQKSNLTKSDYALCFVTWTKMEIVLDKHKTQMNSTVHFYIFLTF